MELEHVKLNHWKHKWKGTWGAVREVCSVPVVPDRDLKVFDKSGFLILDDEERDNLKDGPYSHNVVFSPTHLGGTEAFILSESLPYTDHDFAATSYWFHASRYPEYYFSGDTKRPTLHVGTIGAALERRYVFEEGNEPRGYIHVFKLKSPRRLHKTWVRDDGEPTAHNWSAVSRYINTYECPGSVSLVGHIDNFDLVDSVVVGDVELGYSFDKLPEALQKKMAAYV